MVLNSALLARKDKYLSGTSFWSQKEENPSFSEYFLWIGQPGNLHKVPIMHHFPKSLALTLLYDIQAQLEFPTLFLVQYIIEEKVQVRDRMRKCVETGSAEI